MKPSCSPDRQNASAFGNDSPRGEITVYDVAADGSLANCRMFLDKIGRGVRSEGNVDGAE